MFGCADPKFFRTKPIKNRSWILSTVQGPKPRHAWKTNEKHSWRDSPHMIEVIIKSYLSQVFLLETCTKLIWSWLIWGIFAPGFPMSRSQTSVCHQAFLHHWYSLSLKVILVATCTVYSVLNPGSCPESSKYPLKKNCYTLTICFWNPRYPTTFAFKVSRDDE